MKQLLSLTKRYHHLIAAGLLAVMFVLGVTSMKGDSGIVDEVAHIPAGYSYVHLGDYRLNPEHPPLLKDLAALPLQFMNLKFPTDIPAWTTDVNGQWEAGWHFIYHVGNDANAILFWSRLPILLLAIVFGAVLYLVTLRRFGVATALLALFFFTLEPNMIAHSRFVTTDLGAAAFMFFAIVGFVNYLQKPNRSTLGIAMITFALAQLAKFSSVLLIPVYAALIIVAVAAGLQAGNWKKNLFKYIKDTILIGVGGLLIVWAFYIPHTINMPADVQYKLVDGSLHGGWQRPVAMALVKFNHIPLVKPLMQYVLGVLMVFNRVSSGNTTYFLGEVSNQSFRAFFPVTYLIKTPVAFLVLIALTSLAGILAYLKKKPLDVWNKFKAYAKKHFFELSAFIFIAFYAYVSITGNLNLGIRHLLPILPFSFLLVARGTVKLMRPLKNLRPVHMLVAALMVYYVGTNLIVFPHYLTYFNELVGGPANAYKYESDSSVDWGQDLLRLKTYVDQHPEINKIAVDYFGGGEPKYYFCDRVHDANGNVIDDGVKGYDCSHSKYVEWHAENGDFKDGDYIAVSETFLMNDLYWGPVRGDGGYAKLRAMEPIAKVGYSIYVYKLR